MIEYELPGAKWANVDIVGEFARKDELLKIIGGRPIGTDPVTLEIRTHLVPEPDNPYSKSGKAISVRVDGTVVGYLSEQDAKTWAPELHRIAASGGTPATAGNVYAYSKYNGDMEYSVRVALPDPGFIAPLNTGRLSQIAVLPWGNALQVTKEEDHLTHLFEYVPPSGVGMVILTMHRQQQTLKNGTVKELVEVRLDGERVGQMTPASSAHFLPTIRHAEDMGVELGVWAKLKGSGLAVELVVQGARATGLSDDWLREMPTMIDLVPISDHYDVPNAYVPVKAPRADRMNRVSPRQGAVQSRHERFIARLEAVELPPEIEGDEPDSAADVTARVDSAPAKSELTYFGSVLFRVINILLYVLCVVFVFSGLGAIGDEDSKAYGISFIGVAIFCWFGARKLGKRLKK